MGIGEGGCITVVFLSLIMNDGYWEGLVEFLLPYNERWVLGRVGVRYHGGGIPISTL